MCARVAYCVDIDKSVIIGNFEKRGWVSVGPDDDWHFYWASTTTCRNLFAVDSGFLAKRASLFINFVILGERPKNSLFVSPVILRLHPCPFANGKEATVNRMLDGSTYPS
jgi:tubulin polyglutamylase TTLL1